MSEYDPSLASTATLVGGEGSSAPSSKLEDSSGSEALFITGAGVAPAHPDHPDQWRELKYCFRLRAFRSKRRNTEKYVKVVKALSSLSKVAVRRRQESFKQSRRSGKSWSQMYEENMWIHMLKQTAPKLESLLAVSLTVENEEHLRGEGRGKLGRFVADFGESQSTDAAGKWQLQDSWFDDQEIEKAASDELPLDAATKDLVKITPLDTAHRSINREEWMLMPASSKRVNEVDQLLQFSCEGTGNLRVTLKAGTQVFTNLFSGKSSH